MPSRASDCSGERESIACDSADTAWQSDVFSSGETHSSSEWLGMLISQPTVTCGRTLTVTPFSSRQPSSTGAMEETTGRLYVAPATNSLEQKCFLNRTGNGHQIFVRRCVVCAPRPRTATARSCVHAAFLTRLRRRSEAWTQVGGLHKHTANAGACLVLARLMVLLYRACAWGTCSWGPAAKYAVSTYACDTRQETHTFRRPSGRM
jgi:hypothetical protein